MSILQNNVFGMHFFRIGIFVRQPDRKRKSLEAKSLEEIPKFLCKCGVVNAFLLNSPVPVRRNGESTLGRAISAPILAML